MSSSHHLIHGLTLRPEFPLLGFHRLNKARPAGSPPKKSLGYWQSKNTLGWIIIVLIHVNLCSMVGIRERLSQQNKNNVKYASFTPLWKGTYWLCSPCMEVNRDTFVMVLPRGLCFTLCIRRGAC